MSIQDARREVASMRAQFAVACTESHDILAHALPLLLKVENGDLNPETLAKWCRLCGDAIRSLEVLAYSWRATEAVMVEVEK